MFPAHLVFEAKPSATARAMLLTLHLAGLAALLLALIPPEARLAGGALLGASLYAAWRRPRAPRLRARDDGTLERWRDNAWVPLRLRADSVALPWIIVLRWREGRRSHSLALPVDALPAETHRRLRVWLRWRADVGAAPLQ